MSEPDRSNLALKWWADLRRRLAGGEPARVEDYLADPAFPTDDAELLLDLIYAEFALREQAGETPKVEEYLTRFPQLKGPLGRQLGLHLALGCAGVTLPEVAAPLAPEPPERIGKYRIVALLGVGGQATAYRAVHPALGMDVVVKLGHRRDAPDADALATEGRILAELRHPNLASVLDFDADGGRPFVVMEYVAGRNLEQVARLPARDAVRLVAALSRAVAHAHARGVVHLDVKPANVLLADDGTPRLLDFGLGRLRSGWAAQMDDTTDASGTLAYAAPERLSGKAGQSLECADVFGLGGVLYFCLTGRPPFSGATGAELWANVRAGAWDKEALNRPNVSERLRRICERCLATDPARRYASADALAGELERFVRGPVVSRRALLATGLASVAAVGLAVWLWPRKPIAPLADPELRLRVWDGERYRDLARCLPLQAGDEIRVEAKRPTGSYASLLWVGPDGVVRELATARPEQSETMHYPDAGHAVPLEGGPGTELILMCVRRRRPIDLASLRAKLAEVRAWPPLPGTSILRLGRDGVAVEDHGRGPGPPKRRADAEGDVADRLRLLLGALRQECDAMAGIAVSHR